jgi:hypothetical protein
LNLSIWLDGFAKQGQNEWIGTTISFHLSSMEIENFEFYMLNE